MIHLSSEMIVQVWERQKKKIILLKTWSWEAGGRNPASAIQPSQPRAEQAIQIPLSKYLLSENLQTEDYGRAYHENAPSSLLLQCGLLTSRAGASAITWRPVRRTSGHTPFVLNQNLVRSPTDSYVLWNCFAQTSLPMTIKSPCQSVSPPSIKYNNAT